jgi:hypothetical protein
VSKSNTRKKNKKPSKRGKWAREPWIRILELLAGMTFEERQRCLQATVAFFRGR